MSEHAYTARAASPGAGVSYRRGGPGRRAPLGVGGLLGVAALCLLGMAATWMISSLVPGARVKDAVALHEFTLLSRPHVDVVAEALLHVLEPVPFTVLAAVLVAFAVLRRRPQVAAAVAVVMALAPLSSELLKPLLAHAHDQFAGTYISAASWPSGHATAALALALCAVLVAPARMRPLVAVAGCLYALAVGVSLLILAWHMPSDVIGGYLVAALWMALAVAGLRAASAPRPGARAGAITARA